MLKRCDPLALLALAITLILALQVDPAGSYPQLPQGPGLTLDETFNVQQGVYLVEILRQYGVWMFDPLNLPQIFDNEMYLPDHPPLGRFWLGLHHHLVWSLFPPANPEGPFITAGARVGSVTAFGLTLWLVGVWARQIAGTVAGWGAMLSLALMPRLVTHSQIASLETSMNLTWLAALWMVARQFQHSQSLSFKRSAWAGIFLGLALLTKIQAIFLLPVVCLWALAIWRQRALVPLVTWGCAGAVVFLAGWPWLWLDLPGHLSEYLGRTTDRATLHVYYWGQVFDDKQTPWHYPFVMFLITTPLAILLSSGVAVFRRCRSADKPSPFAGTKSNNSVQHDWLLLAIAILLPLIAFAVPGISAYDGERLFLIVYPPIAILSGCGLARLGSHPLLASRPRWRIGGAATAGVLTLGSLLGTWPCGLSSYNLLIGGLPGAVASGQERDYWSTAITRSLLKEITTKVPAGSTIAVLPVLHQFQLEELRRQSPVARQHDLHFQTVDAAHSAQYVLLFRREADLPPDWREQLTSGPRLCGLDRYGVELAGLYVARKSFQHP